MFSWNGSDCRIFIYNDKPFVSPYWRDGLEMSRSSSFPLNIPRLVFPSLGRMRQNDKVLWLVNPIPVIGENLKKNLALH
jgi:hypothetical protein